LRRQGPVRVGILGGGGYAAGELLRLLAGHPGVELAGVESGTYRGEPVAAAHPHLRGHLELRFCGALDVDPLEVVFVAADHGESMKRLPELLSRAPSLRVVDLTADFRFADAGQFERAHGRAHAAPELLGSFAYGLTELNREAIGRARLVANPGCFATAVGLALGPLALAGFEGSVHATAMTGSSGSGARPSPTTHHPTREGNARAYRPLGHPHAREVESLLDRLAGRRGAIRVALVPVSGPFVRGIYASCQFDLPAGWNERTLRDLYESTYDGAAFVRLLEGPPDLRAVAGTNFCDLHVVARGEQAAILAALDNLVKGGAGQAVQNLNVMMGWQERLGLATACPYP